MAEKILHPRLIDIQRSDAARLQKIRWALRQRLCDQLRQLSGDFLDEVDDFLFTGGQRGQFGHDGSYLKAMREVRTKRDLFEETFLSQIHGNLQSVLGGKTAPSGETGLGSDFHNTVYEKMEIDLALKAMGRRALRLYRQYIAQLDEFEARAGSANSILGGRPDFPVPQVTQAYEKAQQVFKLDLEIRLILLKLFEQHLLLKMQPLYLDIISVLDKQNDEVFVARLYASSTVLRKQKDKGPVSKPVLNQALGLVQPAVQRSTQVDEGVSQAVGALCARPGIPHFMENMIRTQWRNVLFLIGLNTGTTSTEFDQAVDTVERLLNAMLDRSLIGRRQALEALQQELNKGFDLIQMSPADQALFLERFATWKQVTLPPSTGPDVTGTGEKAIGTLGKQYLDDEDLDEIVAMLSDSAAAEQQRSKTEAVDSLSFHLDLADSLEDGAAVIYSGGDQPQMCQVLKSRAIDNSFQICNSSGRVVLTRSRLGLAISLREGELRIAKAADTPVCLPDTLIQSYGDEGSAPTLQ